MMNILNIVPEVVSGKSEWATVRDRVRAAGDLEQLVAAGYSAMIRPAAPPGVMCSFWDQAKGAVVDRISDGKAPSKLRDGKWVGFKGWRKTESTPADIAEWSRWPGPINWCVVTGEVAALDIDVKIERSEAGPEADRGRALAAALKDLAACALGLPVAALPMRWRDNSTSCMILMKLAAPVGKRQLQFVDTVTGREHLVEFLAKGQQIVVAGQHSSGARVRSSLPTIPLDHLPVLEPAKLDVLIPAIVQAAKELGFDLTSSKRSADNDTKPPYPPAMAVLNAVMARRSDWVPSIVPRSASADREWRISSAELDRDLEEDLVIFTDGIHDYGAEWTHNPASLIREFGAVDSAGEINFGGSPFYGPVGGRPYAPVGEPDTSVRRPTEAEALTWLCRQLAGDQFPEFGEGATWASSLQTVARAVGLRWTALEAARWFKFAEGDGPAAWNPDKLIEEADTLAALLAVDPVAFAGIEFAHEMNSTPLDLRQVVAERCAAVAATAHEKETPPKPGDDLPEPLDIFTQNDPADLSTLPSNCLPEMLRRWVGSESRRKGTPESFAAIAAVAVASAAIGASARIQIRKFDTGFTQPAGLWACIIAAPGSAKSPIIKAAEKPLRNLDAEWHRVWKLEHDMWDVANQAHKSRRKDASPPGPEPIQKRCVVDDVTLEKQVQLHAHNPRGLMRSPDELLSLFGSLGAYKRSGDGDRSQALRLFDGSAISVDRVNGGSIRADSALMTVIASSQPQKIAEIATNLGADGMLQRFVFILDDDVDRRGIDEPPDEEAAAAYARAIQMLASNQPADGTPIRMAPEAQNTFDAAAEQIARLKNAPGLSTAWQGHVAKFGMILPRIVLVFHGLEAAFRSSGSLPPTVSLGTVEKAVSFSRFVLRHSMAFYSRYFEPNTEASDARGVAGYLLTKPDLTTLSRRTVYDARTDLRDRRRLFAAMAELEIANWVAVNKRDQDGPSEWRVNVRIHQRFEAQAVREKAERASKRKAIAAAGQARKWVNSDKLSAGGSHDE
ncbi:DUF3987 domain-containing protein [Mesorhizobium sp. WSM3873]|uniref:DUF3987 domain-containing protein n=1 Tax=Mesorhizobium sp. WSM3873 TaxID=1854056 RepID=UPI0007FD3E83|nr:DUF3987 domain-containing protein [Mesorhizobium sp. WSM3873]OBQ77407.1 hypothetical protein A9K71_10290 [Mesorhizobium sp. WSM3873]